MLTIANLREVRRLLYPVRRKWYSIGLELNIEPGELDTIKYTHHHDVGACLIEVLKIWLKSIDPPPTWKALSDALTTEPVYELELAAKAIHKDQVTPESYASPSHHQQGVQLRSQRLQNGSQTALKQPSTFSSSALVLSTQTESKSKEEDSDAKRHIGQPMVWIFTDSVQSDGPGCKIKSIQHEVFERGTRKPILKLADDDTPTLIDSQTYHQASSSVGYYNMTNLRHGVVLIFNNQHFTRHEERKGTQRDEYNILETCFYLGYRPVVFSDSPKADFLKIFRYLDTILNDSNAKAKETQKVANDSFLCFILSHGVEGAIISSDSEEIEIKEIEKLVGESQILNSKPKIFFVQACQGPGYGTEPVTRVRSDGGETTSRRNDIYITYATVPGDKSYRDESKGSWFITEVCKILCEFAKYDKFPSDFQPRLNKNVSGSDNYRYYDEGTKKLLTQMSRGSHQLQNEVHFFHTSGAVTPSCVQQAENVETHKDKTDGVSKAITVVIHSGGPRIKDDTSSVPPNTNSHSRRCSTTSVKWTTLTLVILFVYIWYQFGPTNATAAGGHHKMKESEFGILEDYLSKIDADLMKICMHLNLTNCNQLKFDRDLTPFHLAQSYLRQTAEPYWEDIVRMLCTVFKHRRFAKSVAEKHGIDYQLYCSIDGKE